MEPEFKEAFDQNDADNLDAMIEETARAAEDACSADEAPEIVTISKAELEKLRADLADAQDRGLRALAELENYRARTTRLQQEERKYASMDLARAILPVWDNLNLAMKIEEPEKNGAAVLDGVKMVAGEFLRILDQNGIVKIDALNKPFDPSFHESVAFAPSPDCAPNTVVHVLKDGFVLNDRVVRPAQVVLAAPQAPAAE